MRFARYLLIVLLLLSATPVVTAKPRNTGSSEGFVSRAVVRIIRITRFLLQPTGRMSPPVGSPSTEEPEEQEPTPVPATTTT